MLCKYMVMARSFDTQSYVLFLNCGPVEYGYLCIYGGRVCEMLFFSAFELPRNGDDESAGFFSLSHFSCEIYCKMRCFFVCLYLNLSFESQDGCACNQAFLEMEFVIIIIYIKTALMCFSFRRFIYS